MRFFYSTFNAMFNDSSGAVLVEYALVLTLISAVGFAGFTAVAMGVSHMYVSDTNGMTNMATSANLYQPLP